MRLLSFLLLLMLLSCSPYRGLLRKEFTTGGIETTNRFGLLVPKGYTKEVMDTDSSGNRQQLYYYSNGAFLYFVQLRDTTKEYRFIDKERNVALEHPSGGVMYKGIDSSYQRYWREVRKGTFRVGYQAVPHDLEIKFDTVVNYAAARVPR